MMHEALELGDYLLPHEPWPRPCSVCEFPESLGANIPYGIGDCLWCTIWRSCYHREMKHHLAMRDEIFRDFRLIREAFHQQRHMSLREFIIRVTRIIDWVRASRHLKRNHHLRARMRYLEEQLRGLKLMARSGPTMFSHPLQQTNPLIAAMSLNFFGPPMPLSQPRVYNRQVLLDR